MEGRCANLRLRAAAADPWLLGVVVREEADGAEDGAAGQGGGFFGGFAGEADCWVLLMGDGGEGEGMGGVWRGGGY